MIPVTKPFFPPFEEYTQLISGIWDKGWITNNGPVVRELEQRLKDYLNIDFLSFVGNGTIAMQIGLQALGVRKKVITTPFSYIATTSSIAWEGCVPTFVDIDPYTLNIDPTKIEAAIDSETEAILATHCFGNPCDIEEIQRLASSYGLKVMYDAAHCFGVQYRGKSIFDYGDLSTTSFHATKLFHTVEGGAIFTKDDGMLRKVNRMRNFGHDGPEKFDGIGINGKNSEIHASMGILNLNYIDDILKSRENQSGWYDEKLDGLNISKQQIRKETTYNYSYYPVLFESEAVCLSVKAALEQNEIFPRRYFYPSLNNLNYTKGSATPVSNDVSSRILCLPMFYELTEQDIDKICKVISHNMN